jgi:D-alanyl-D-alanine endopeptidase (penicillin-binding protein 7)
MVLNKFKKIFLFSLLSLIAGGFVLAQEIAAPPTGDIPNREYYINLDKATIAKGYTVGAFENNLKLSLVPGILSEATGVEMVELNEEMETPWQLDRISKIYQFEFRNSLAYDNHKPFYIQFSYDKETNNYKQVFFYDKNYNSWRPLPTKDFPEQKFVRSLIHLPYARIAVFDNPDILAIGNASWYGYKGGNFAASPDFPKGSKLRVVNTENNKFVDVEINDYGPDRILHPTRVIDLDKIAFAKIASLGDGIVNVRIEPISVEPKNNKILNIASSGATTLPVISAKSVIVINEETGESIYEKNATTTLPLASLTKLVAIKVFLDTSQSLNNAVAYSVKDEEYNYEYCEKWESARLKLDDGETLTIEDLIYSSLVGSTNNTVETLARVSGLGRDNFIAKMNEAVKLWGANATHFIEPTGLAPENVSSAADYAIITKEVFKHPIIQKASASHEYKFSTINAKKAHRIKNTNKITGFKITGSKTGYLNEAGYCLMIRAQAPSGEQVVVVTMGIADRNTSFLETEELLRYGLRQIKNSK